MNAVADEAISAESPTVAAGDVHETAARDSHRGDETGAAALVDALRDDVGDRRPRHDRERDRREAEEPESRDGRHQGTAR